MDFREELNKLKNEASTEEFISATILMAKIILKHSQKEGVFKIVFAKSDDDSIIASVETDSGEKVVLFKKKITLNSIISLSEIQRILNKEHLYSVLSKDCKTLCLMPNRW